MGRNPAGGAVGLGMDELTDVLETLQRRTGPDGEITFGYGVAPTLPAEMRVTFLVAPGAA